MENALSLARQNLERGVVGPGDINALVKGGYMSRAEALTYEKMWASGGWKPGPRGSMVPSGEFSKSPISAGAKQNVPGSVGPGRHARDSVPAGPTSRPTAEQQQNINRIGNKSGCHTCGTSNPGTKSGNWIGDHQPPTKLNSPGSPQVYHPQCQSCSNTQGGMLRWMDR